MAADEDGKENVRMENQSFDVDSSDHDIGVVEGVSSTLTGSMKETMNSTVNDLVGRGKDTVEIPKRSVERIEAAVANESGGEQSEVAMEDQSSISAGKKTNANKQHSPEPFGATVSITTSASGSPESATVKERDSTVVDSTKEVKVGGEDAENTSVQTKQQLEQTLEQLTATSTESMSNREITATSSLTFEKEQSSGPSMPKEKQVDETFAIEEDMEQQAQHKIKHTMQMGCTIESERMTDTQRSASLLDISDIPTSAQMERNEDEDAKELFVNEKKQCDDDGQPQEQQAQSSESATNSIDSKKNQTEIMIDRKDQSTIKKTESVPVDFSKGQHPGEVSQITPVVEEDEGEQWFPDADMDGEDTVIPITAKYHDAYYHFDREEDRMSSQQQNPIAGHTLADEDSDGTIVLVSDSGSSSSPSNSSSSSSSGSSSSSSSSSSSDEEEKENDEWHDTPKRKKQRRAPIEQATLQATSKRAVPAEFDIFKNISDKEHEFPILKGTYTFRGNHRACFIGMWAFCEDDFQADPPRVSKFEYTSSYLHNRQDGDRRPYSGKYSGYFNFRQFSGRNLKIRDDQLELHFVPMPNEDGESEVEDSIDAIEATSYEVFGRGRNRFGKFLIRGYMNSDAKKLIVRRRYLE